MGPCRRRAVVNSEAETSLAMSAVIFIGAVILIAVLVGVYQKNTNGICRSQKSLSNKTVLVTGGTTGMGLKIATDFARRKAKVIIACPFEAEGAAAKKIIAQKAGHDNIVFKLLDLSSLKSVREFAADILKTEDALHVLVNNAGVGVPDDFTTADGMSFIMQVNYFGHFLLTVLLLPLLRKSGAPGEPSRIVNTSSVLHLIGTDDLRSTEATSLFYKVLVYSNSKFCLIPFARELTKRLRNAHTQPSVVINSVDPGFVGTGIFNSSGKILGAILIFLSGRLFKSPWEGAQTALHVALDEKAGEVSGEFFKNCEHSRAKSSAYNDKVAARLWNESVRLVKLTDDEVIKCIKS